jgi:hypothetical protein
MHDELRANTSYPRRKATGVGISFASSELPKYLRRISYSLGINKEGAYVIRSGAEFEAGSLAKLKAESILLLAHSLSNSLLSKPFLCL